MLTSRQYHDSVKEGFTLIEILVSLAIMITVLGLGIAGFIRFNERQQVKAFANQIQTVMRVGQAKAQVKDISTPAGQDCDFLTSYRIVQSESNFYLRMRCDTSAGQVYNERSVAKPTGIVVSDFGFFDFLPLQGRIRFNNNDSTESINIIVSNTSNTIRYQFTVTSGGSISDGGFLP